MDIDIVDKLFNIPAEEINPESFKRMIVRDDFLARLRDILTETVSNDVVPDAVDLARLIKKILIILSTDSDGNATKIIFQYKDSLAWCNWERLPLLSQSDVEELFNKGLKYYFDLPAEYNLREKVRAFLETILLEDRDVVKEKFRTILLNNTELVGSRPIIRGGEEVAQTVGNWLRDYISFGATAEKTFLLSKYIMENENMRQFDPVMQSKFRELFQLFDRLKISSLTAEGLEDEVLVELETGELVMFKDGDFQPFSNEAIDKAAQRMVDAGLFGVQPQSGEVMLSSVPLTSEEIMKIYEGDKNENETIHQEKLKMQQLIKGNYGGLAEYFYQAVFPREGLGINKVRVIALLQLLAQNGLVDDIITTDQRIFNKVTEYLQVNAGDKVADFKMHPTVPGNMALFLQYVFRDRLKLDDSEAARHTARLANYFKLGGEEKYANLVYFDMGSCGFKWK